MGFRIITFVALCITLFYILASRSLRLQADGFYDGSATEL